MERDILQIGVVRRAHGVRGQIRVSLHDPASAALHTLSQIGIGTRRYDILAVQELGGGFLLTLHGLTDRDAAEALQGQPLWARRDELPRLDEGEFYVADLVGCAVHATDGTVVGQVTEVPLLGGQDMLVIATPDQREVLVPLQPEFVTFVDLAARRVDIDPPEGLLDVDRAEAP